MVRVRYVSFLKQVAGCGEESVSVPPSRLLSDLLEAVLALHPGILGTSSAYQWRHGSTHVLIAVNGRIVKEGDEDPGTVQIADGDDVMLMAALGGG